MTKTKKTKTEGSSKSKKALIAGLTALALASAGTITGMYIKDNRDNKKKISKLEEKKQKKYDALKERVDKELIETKEALTEAEARAKASAKDIAELEQEKTELEIDKATYKTEAESVNEFLAVKQKELKELKQELAKVWEGAMKNIWVEHYEKFYYSKIVEFLEKIHGIKIKEAKEYAEKAVKKEKERVSMEATEKAGVIKNYRGHPPLEFGIILVNNQKRLKKQYLESIGGEAKTSFEKQTVEDFNEYIEAIKKQYGIEDPKPKTREEVLLEIIEKLEQQLRQEKIQRGNNNNYYKNKLKDREQENKELKQELAKVWKGAMKNIWEAYYKEIKYKKIIKFLVSKMSLDEARTKAQNETDKEKKRILNEEKERADIKDIILETKK